VAQNKVNIDITAHDMASAAIERARQNMKSLGSQADSVAAQMKTTAVAMAGAFAAFNAANYIKDATMLAARVETLGTVMKVIGNNAGYSGSQMTVFENQVKAMGITTQEARNNLVKMAGSQMDLTKAADLARIAQDAGRIGNINSSEAFARLIQGVRSGELEILKNIGINVQFEEGYKKTAATLGTTADKLSAAEKMTSRMNQVLEFGKNIAGAYEASMSTVGGQMSSLARHTEEVKLKLGEAFTPALVVVIAEINRSLKEMNSGMAANKDGIKSFGEDLRSMTASALNYVKTDLIQISSLIMDIKASGYRLGSWAAIPGMVAGSDTYNDMVKTANGYTAAAKAQRDYLEGMQAVKGSAGVDASDSKNLFMAQAAQEQKRIAAGEAVRAAAEKARVKKEKPTKYSRENDLLLANIKEYAALMKDQEQAFYTLGQEMETTAQAAANVFNINTMQGGSVGDRYKVTPLSKYGLNTAFHGVPQTGIDPEQEIKRKAAASWLVDEGKALNSPDAQQALAIQKQYNERKTIADQFRSEELISQKEHDDLMLSYAQSKAEAMTKITTNSYMEIGSIMTGQLGQMAGMMDKSNRDQFNAYKAMMIAQATIATAMAVVGIMAAESKLGMFAIPLAFTAGAIGAAQIGMIAGQQYSGARALGGPVNGGASYLVGEKGPEIFTPGASGTITPNNAIGGKAVAINQSFNITGVGADIMQNTKIVAKQAADAAKAQILNSMNRGGEFALASGRIR
jgi:hypothetical protein